MAACRTSRHISLLRGDVRCGALASIDAGGRLWPDAVEHGPGSDRGGGGERPEGGDRLRRIAVSGARRSPVAVGRAGKRRVYDPYEVAPDVFEVFKGLPKNGSLGEGAQLGVLPRLRDRIVGLTEDLDSG
jgi:hypothetical protein